MNAMTATAGTATRPGRPPRLRRSDVAGPAVFTIRLDDATCDAVEELARVRDTSVSELLRHTVFDLLERAADLPHENTARTLPR
ncbi:MAG TPA: CopG family transcriptional regulator [Pseudonocardia sp.]